MARKKGSTYRTKPRNFAAIDHDWANQLFAQFKFTPHASVDKLYSSVFNIILEVIDSAPLRRIFKHRPPAWDAARIKNRAWRIYRAYPSLHNRMHYETISEMYAEAVTALRSNRFRSICDSSDRRAFYQHHSNSKDHSSLLALRRSDGVLCSSDYDRAQTFLQAFNSVYRPDSPVDFSKFTLINTSPDFSNLFAPHIVHNLIKTLRTRTAAGPDGIPAVILKNYASGIAPLLSNLFCLIFHGDWIPPIWRLATIIPVFKGKGSASSVDNYRPIALTSILSKLYEKCILRYLLSYLTTSSLIPPSQFGGLPGRSSTLQLVFCYDQWTYLQDSHSPFDVFFLDISKAFDRIPRSKLASCLCDMSIPHIVVRAIMRLFDGRRHQVRVGSSLSAVSSTTSGVVQGTILGCILFIVYTAPLSTIIRPTLIFSFIDDIKWTISISNNTNAQDHLDEIISWLAIHGLETSMAKSQVLHCGGSNPSTAYTINGTTINACSIHSDLGVSFSHDLRFTRHIESIVYKANRALFGVLTRYKGCDRPSLSLAFSTFVRPIIEYASPVWSPSYVLSIDYIEKVQRVFTRRLFSPHHPPYNVRCALLSIHSLEWRRLYLDLCLMYRILSSQIYQPPLLSPITLRPRLISREHQR